MPCIVWTYLKSFNRLIYLFILNWSNSHSIILDHFLAPNSNFSSYKNNFPRKLLYTTATWRILFYIFFLLQVPKKLLNVIGPAFLELAEYLPTDGKQWMNPLFCLALLCALLSLYLLNGLCWAHKSSHFYLSHSPLHLTEQAAGYCWAELPGGVKPQHRCRTCS